MSDDGVSTKEEAKARLGILQTRRETVFAQITATRDVSKGTGPTSISNFLARCTELGEMRDKFTEIQDDIIQMNQYVDAVDRLPVDSITVAFDAIYYEIKATELVMNGRMGNRSQEANPEESLKLPRILVPKWDGNIDTFPNFFALFNQVVHKGPFSPVTKLTYLRSLLSGPPLKLIQEFKFTEADYAQAYRQLQLRYASSRRLASNYLDKIFEFRPLRSEDRSELQSFLDVFDSSYAAYLNLEIPNHHDFAMCHFALRQLHPKTRLLFERSLRDSDMIPTFDQLITFIRDQCKIQELTRPNVTPRKGWGGETSKLAVNKTSNPPTSRSQTLLVTPSSKKGNTSKKQSLAPASPPTPAPAWPSPLCGFCGQDHKLYSCPKYKALNVDERYAFLRKENRCFRCLGSHWRSACKSTGTCLVPGCDSSKHHSTLHTVNSKSEATVAPSTLPSEEGAASLLALTSVEQNSETPATTMLTGPSSIEHNEILLGTAKAFVLNHAGDLIPIRIVIDSGSKVNLITTDAAKRIGLPIIAKTTHLSGALNQQLGVSPGVMNLTVTPKAGSSQKWNAQAVVVNRVCANLPLTSVPKDVVQRFTDLHLADSEFHKPGKIDFLLGAALYPNIFESSCQILHGQPAAIETAFGWVIIGGTPARNSHADASLSLFTLDTELQDVLQSFWKTEEVSVETPVDPLHAIAEQHFETTHTRLPDGSYVVRLPFHTNESKPLPPFGNSTALSERRWYNMEHKLRKDKILREAYHDFMKKYLDLGHMEPIPNPGVYVIPHFAVCTDSPTSPVRVVFDGSSRDTSGVSLNERLLSGPPLQRDITEVLTHFRLKPVAITTDIKMYYRRIWLHPDDRKFQTIVWRPSEDEPLQYYALKTVTYGLTPSAYQAQKCLRDLATKEAHRFPLASKTVMEACFMDDIAYSVENIEIAQQLKNELIEMLGLASFELRKWASNEPSILADLPPEHKTTVLNIASPDANNGEKLHILGIQWDPIGDVFTYKITPQPPAKTKRNVSSRIGSIFDPLGWISPVVFAAKCFLQELWINKMDWDTPLPPTLAKRWAVFTAQLDILSEVKLPRLCVTPGSTVQLIGMCDASMSGYAALVYLRSESADGVSVSLLKAKTKVAPLVVQTVPRLELMGAVLLTKLVKSLQFVVEKLHIEEIHLFTDSQVVLSWINTQPHLLKTFVANRVVNILESTELSQWRHIPTAENSADIASRGLTPPQIIHNSLWWKGPGFLLKPQIEWPSPRPDAAALTSVPELKEVSESITLALSAGPPVKEKKPKKSKPILDLIEKCSSLITLQRVVAWIRRFAQNVRTPKAQRNVGPLRVSELKEAMKCCILITQQQYFFKEFQALRKGRAASKPLCSLTPFIDKNKILRVGGRLRHAQIPMDAVHPVILPKEARLSHLIIDHYHHYMLHTGPNTTHAVVNRRFWILSSRSLVRARIKRCLICHLTKGNPVDHPVMGDLPPERVNPFRPFLHSGVDMAGPLYIKSSSLRSAKIVKAYICIFVCLSTKAVHIELTGDMSTASFKGALDRFIARRGMPQKIFSDRGSNFVGAANEHRSIVKFLKETETDITDYLSSREIEYRFNPPDAPWMGGIWEAAVKSAKRHLYRITANRALTYEEMITFLARIEAAMNSRPLCPNDDPNVPYLSPGHFLIGGPLTCPVEQDFIPENESLLRRWEFVQRASQEFWRRWSSEYLNTLIQRKKWTSPRNPLQIGEPVFIFSENTRPLDWPLGRIVKLNVGDDGISRSAEVCTPTGIVVRPVAKLVPLPLEDNH